MATNSSDNIKRSDNIRLGIICECEEGANFGWLYSYLCYYYKTDQSESKVNSIRLFFTFKKKTDFVLSDGTPVAFVSIDDINGYAENIMELNNLPFLDSETGKESDDQIIDEYNHKRLPYWEICYKSKSSNPDYYCLIYPVNDRVTHESKLAYSVLVGKEKDLFKLIYSLHKIAYKYLSLDEMTQKLVSIKKYVDSFSIEEVLKTYQCYEWGYLQYRPGRDDHFFYGSSKTIDTDDEYIKSIIPLGSEQDYYSCVGRGKDDEDYDRVDQWAVDDGKRIARESYSKDKHYAFIVSAFFEKYFSSKIEHEAIISQMKDLKLCSRFRYDNLGYGKYLEENLTKRFKSLNTYALKEYKQHKQ